MFCAPVALPLPADTPFGALAQAVLTASGTIRFAITQAGDAASFATVPDWRTVQRELLHALHVAGHPAGRA